MNIGKVNFLEMIRFSNNIALVMLFFFMTFGAAVCSPNLKKIDTIKVSGGGVSIVHQLFVHSNDLESFSNTREIAKFVNSNAYLSWSYRASKVLKPVALGQKAPKTVIDSWNKVFTNYKGLSATTRVGRYWLQYASGPKPGEGWVLAYDTKLKKPFGLVVE